MFNSLTTYIGIDPTAGQRPFTYAALDGDLRLLALGQGGMDEVLAFVAGQHHAYVAVSAPARPSQGVLERPEVRAALNPAPRPGRWAGFRLAEYQLRQRGIACTPASADETRCPNWMRVGFSLYRRLEELGYAAYPAAESPATLPPRQWLEVYPHAAFCTLLGMTPFPKPSLEGRIQRQLVLFDQKLRLADPMDLFEEITRHRLLQGILPLDNLYSPAELDVLMAAYIAWLVANHPERTCVVGHPDEGQVVLPVAELKGKYR